MAALHYQLSHLGQQLRAQQTDVVHHRLILVHLLVRDTAVAQKAAQRPVLVHQLVQAVPIAAQPLHHHAHHQDPPHLHPRAPDRAVDPGKDVLLEKREQPLARVLIAVEVLKALQECGDVVPGLQVEIDVLDADPAQFHLWIADMSHGASSRRFPKKARFSAPQHEIRARA